MKLFQREHDLQQRLFPLKPAMRPSSNAPKAHVLIFNFSILKPSDAAHIDTCVSVSATRKIVMESVAWPAQNQFQSVSNRRKQSSKLLWDRDESEQIMAGFQSLKTTKVSHAIFLFL